MCFHTYYETKISLHVRNSFNIFLAERFHDSLFIFYCEFVFSFFVPFLLFLSLVFSIILRLGFAILHLFCEKSHAHYYQKLVEATFELSNRSYSLSITCELVQNHLCSGNPNTNYTDKNHFLSSDFPSLISSKK